MSIRFDPKTAEGRDIIKKRCYAIVRSKAFSPEYRQRHEEDFFYFTYIKMLEGKYNHTLFRHIWVDYLRAIYGQINKNSSDKQLAFNETRRNIFYARELSKDDINQEQESFEEKFISKKNVEVLLKNVNRLSKLILKLRFIYGYTDTEIAKMCQCSTATISVTISESIKKIRKHHANNY